jgi:ferredoxin
MGNTTEGAVASEDERRSPHLEVEVDYERCEATGFCAEIAPEVFAIRDGKLVLLTSLCGPEMADRLQDAENTCPTQAITVTFLQGESWAEGGSQPRPRP